MRYRITNWTQYQHYKDRCPPWIKLHHAMLTSEVWVMGTDATRTLAIACMLLASRNEDNDGSFNGDPEYIKRFAYLNSKPDFKQLIEFKFIELVQDASISIAPCNTEQSREETEQSRDKAEGEKRKDVIVSPFVLPDWVNADHWELWIKTRKGKKMLPEQMQAQIDKLDNWRQKGLDYGKALADSAANGWQGLFEPKESAQRLSNVQDARLDVARQIMGGDRNGNQGQIIDVTPTRSDSSNGARIPETIDGLRKPTVG